MTGNRRLIYVHDPMCSWCWAFRPVLDCVTGTLDDSVGLTRWLGGLAPDTAEPMPDALRETLKATWRRIQEHVPGTHFDFGFWEENVPKRATYRACRAVIAAREQDPSYESPMIDAIQRAYYLERRNPSERDVLIDLARGLGCDTASFAEALDDDRTQSQLDDERQLAASIGARGFPSLYLAIGNQLHPLPTSYGDAQPILDRIEVLRAS